MEYLRNKLSKDIYSIIYNYFDQSEEHLNKIFNKVKYRQHPYTDTSIFILDLISKAIQLGYSGVSIPNISREYINYTCKYIEKHNINYIITENIQNITIFYLKGRRYKVIDISCLNIIKYITILKN